jgi:signal transduction histidine kinase
MFTNNDQTLDREQVVRQMFNPEDLAIWGKYSTREFLAIAIHEMKHERAIIDKYVELIREHPAAKAEQQLQPALSTSLPQALDIIQRSSRILERLQKTIEAYSKTLEPARKPAPEEKK